MQAKIFDHVPSGINLGSISIALRAAYLIADSVLCAGDTYAHIFYEKYASECGLEARFKLLQDQHERNQDLESVKALEEMRSTYKKTGKVKSKRKEDIVLMKRIENIVNSTYKQMTDNGVAKLKQFGCIQLRPLLEDQSISVYPMPHDSAEEKSEGFFPASELLTRNTGDQTPDEIFCLTAEFFKPEFIARFHVADAITGNGKGDYFYFEPFFKFPNINALVAEELKAVRSQLQPEAQAFCKAVDAWAGLLHTSAPVDETVAGFRAMREASLRLKEGIEKNEILQHVKSIAITDSDIEVFLGIAPVAVIWEFYRHFEVMKPETDEKLRQLKNEKAYAGHWPVMLLRHEQAKEKGKSVTEQQEVAPVKKSLSLD